MDWPGIERLWRGREESCWGDGCRGLRDWGEVSGPGEWIAGHGRRLTEGMGAVD